MQLVDRIQDCNGCGACVVACKYRCVKMKKDENGNNRPVVNENGCNKCNACVLFCPVYNPVDMPGFEEFYDAPEEENVRGRDMAPIYRATMRAAREGRHAEFAGTLCQIAALKSLRGDTLDNIAVFPVFCDDEQRRSNPACAVCKFYE